MEQMVAELRKIISFKDTTVEGDVVLVAAKNPEMLVYGRVGSIERDTTRKDEWWHVTLHLLSIPMQKVVWTLRTPQFSGEIFTMGGEGRFIQAVSFEEEKTLSPVTPPPQPAKKSKPHPSGLRVVK